jgi:hypothetical protein
MSDIVIRQPGTVRARFGGSQDGKEDIRDPGGGSAATPATSAPQLRRNLGSWQVLAVSLGVTGLSLPANINPQGAVPSVGRAIPLASEDGLVKAGSAAPVPVPAADPSSP